MKKGYTLNTLVYAYINLTDDELTKMFNPSPSTPTPTPTLPTPPTSIQRNFNSIIMIVIIIIALIIGFIVVPIMTLSKQSKKYEPIEATFQTPIGKIKISN